MTKKILFICDKSDLDEIIGKFEDNDVEIFSIFEHKLVEKLDFENYEQLALDAKSLGINYAVVSEIDALKNNAVEIFKNYGLDTYGVTPKFLRYQLSKLDGKSFFLENGIKTPKTLNLFFPIFPAVIRKNSSEKSEIYYNQQEKERLFTEFSNDFFVEEFIDGIHENLQIFFNGKSFEISPDYDEKVQAFVKKLENVFNSAGADFKASIELDIIYSASGIYLADINFSKCDFGMFIL